MVYVNETDNKTLIETDRFNCEGHTLVGYDDMSEVKFEVGPGERKVLKLETGSGGWSFGISSSYSVRTD